ncbi:hypothetical protein G6M89_03210 [Natronolimnobius sp. AArcel1]|uniref:hypothetical protein n=1 Tax=Natronolimnobius sp. AArcel1 TaxID=1679093 RepID=UPI0013EB8C22|nr:hypothetical protein [Natronolimnobius sp. AArcel1]NGM68029.1 hypothetical protein [Natronolimnobius sp. AArcel1]
MTRSHTSSSRPFTVTRNRFDDEWTVDDEGCLHMGTATPFAERVSVTNRTSR